MDRVPQKLVFQRNDPPAVAHGCDSDSGAVGGRIITVDDVAENLLLDFDGEGVERKKPPGKKLGLKP